MFTNLDELLDKNLQKLSLAGASGLSKYELDVSESPQNGNIQVILERLSEEMESVGIAELRGNYLYITTTGMEIQEFGGWVKNLEALEERDRKKAEKEQEIENLKLKVLKSDVLKAKTYLFVLIATILNTCFVAYKLFSLFFD